MCSPWRIPRPRSCPTSLSRRVRVIGTGRSDFPNQVNNVLAFPGIFKGALSVRARDINPAMKMAAAKAIAGLIPDDELNEENILPKAFDPRVPMPSLLPSHRPREKAAWRAYEHP